MSNQTEYEFRPAINKHFIRFFYDIYCSLGNLGKNFKRKVVALAKIKDGECVVDLGCGTGVLLSQISIKYPDTKLIGIDPDELVLSIARRRLEKMGAQVEFLQDYAEKLSLQNSFADVVISTLVFHHMPNDIKQKASSEIYRILKPGGRAIVADFGPGRISPYLFEKREYMEGNVKGLVPVFLKEAGFREVTVVGKHFPGVSIIEARK